MYGNANGFSQGVMVDEGSYNPSTEGRLDEKRI